MSLLIFVLLLRLSACVVFDDENNKLTYGGYQVWTANIGGRNVSTEIIDAMYKNDVWRADENSIDFLLNSTETEYWATFLNSHNISYTVLLDNVQDSIEKEEPLKKRGSRRVDWESFPNLNEIDEFLKSKANADPVHCSLRTIGKTIYNKEIKMMKISNGKPGNMAILIETGIHGREWLAITTLLYFVDVLTANFSGLPPRLRQKDWYIIPLVNPDGYEYTRLKDRMWRKNRRRFSGSCDGVDIMSNFEQFFGARGTSRHICSAEYCGPHPFSEQESIAIRAINKVHKMRFKAGTTTTLGSRRTTGTPIDWAFQQDIVHSYLIETRGISYLAKTNEILLSGKEITAGLKRLGELLG